MLGWSMVELAASARVSVSAVKRFEDGGTQAAVGHEVALITDALETEGVRFLPDDGTGAGLRFRRR